MQGIAETPTVRIGNVGAIPSVFNSLGLDLHAALRCAGLSLDAFDSPETIVPYKALDELIAYAVRASSCDHVGLLIGVSTPDLGLPSLLLFNAPSIREGLQVFIAALDRADAGGAATLAEFDGTAILAYRVGVSGLKCVDHIHDSSIAIGYLLLSRLIGPCFEPTEIRLTRCAPVDATPYRAHFKRGQIRFASREAAIEFPASYLDRPAENADPAIYRFLKGLLAEQGAQIDPSMTSQVRRVLPGLIRRKPVNQAAIAQMFGMHPRTMSRRLAGEETTLHVLIEDARFEVAQQLLRDTELGLAKIATDLCYSDASAFARAFRRKFGAPPGAWRSTHRERR